MRFAHFSDPHLLSLAGVHLTDFLNKRWIGGLNLLVGRGRAHRTDIFDALVDDLNQRQVDHVVCTGDVTNVALEEEFAFARAHFDRIALGPAEVTVIPGNHDAYVAQGTAHFHRYFREFHRGDPDFDDGYGAAWPLVRVRGQIAVVGLTTSHQTPWFTAYGRIGAAQLAAVSRVLADPRLGGLFRVVAVHHPPAGGTSASRVRGLRDRDQLAAVLAETGAELVLHGHEHRDLRAELAGPGGAPIPVRGIPSGSCEVGRPALRARYRIYEIGAAETGRDGARPQIAGEEVRVWDPEAGAFAAKSPPGASRSGAAAPAGMAQLPRKSG